MIKVKSFRGSYNVEFFSLKKFLKNRNNLKYIYVIDSTLIKKYTFIKNFSKNKKIIIVNANENSKDFKKIFYFIKIFSKFQINKNSKIVGIGGGVTQDIVCFIASIYMRGIEWIFIPTTLESQADSCIGSKSSINLMGRKNQIGTFYPPSKVLIDIHLLKTLKTKLIWSGLGEMLHYFLFNEKDFHYFKKNFKKVFHDEKIIQQLIIRSLKIKKIIIEKDEFDKSERKLLNYGHTFGHAIEGYTNYKIPHGIAVAYGIDIANYLSLKKKFITKKKFLEIKFVIDQIVKDFKLPKIKIQKYIEFIKKDKKASNQNINLILFNGKKPFIFSQKFSKSFYHIILDYFQKIHN